MSGKLFRTRLFGFKKSDVNKYIESISNEFAVKIGEKDEEIEMQREQLSQFQQQVDKLLEEKGQFEKEKDSISGAIIKAEKNASLIIEEAKRTALEEKLKLKKEIEDNAAELRRLRHEVSGFRKQVISSIKRFSSDLGTYNEEKNSR